VYTWGKGYCGALGHGVELDETTPLLVSSLKDVRVVQVGILFSKLLNLCLATISTQVHPSFISPLIAKAISNIQIGASCINLSL
jgi:hypothetical protein